MAETGDRLRIEILFAHPALDKSRIHRRLLPAVRDIEGVTVQDLYEIYPDFDVDIAAEQAMLVQHDLIIFQHPMYWYSTPALVKQWIDLVLEHGWAYGEGGTALQGKQVLSVITAGGGEKAYQRGGMNGFSVRELLAPIEQTVRLCNMEYLPPYVIHGAHALSDAQIGRAAEEYRRVVVALRDRTLDLETARTQHRLNADLSTILGRQE